MVPKYYAASGQCFVRLGKRGRDARTLKPVQGTPYCSNNRFGSALSMTVNCERSGAVKDL